MAYVKKNWKNRQSENPNRRRLVPTGEANVYDVAREEGLVLEEGDAFSDQTMNDLENRIAAGFDETAPVSHVTDSSIHVTAADKSNWNSKAAGNHSHNLLTYTATHSKNGTVHTLAGLPTAAGIYIAQFKAVANFDAGNTFAGGYTAKPMGEETTLPDKAFITGDLVSVVVDVSGKKLGFRLGGAGAPKFPTYTGAHAIFGTEKQGYMELYSSGTLTAQANMTVEAFLVGGGASGGSPLGAIGGGGGSGYVKLLQGVNILKSSQYPVVIGAGGVAVTSGGVPCVAGGSTSIFSNTVLGGKTAATAAHGSDGGSGGGEAGAGSGSVPGGDGGRNGANGVETTTSATAGVGAGISTIYNGKEYAGGGGGGGYGSVRGGLGFAGAGNGGLKSQPGEAALANTGSGGGGGGSGALSGGNGGSGIVIIRWGY